MKTVRERYDAQYFDSLGDRLPFYRDIITQRYANLVREIAPGGRLLELGCGDGRLLQELAGDFEVTGIDISVHAIARARERVPQATLRVGDIAVCPTEARYDIVLALNVLEHLPNPEIAMLRVREMLTEGGEFIFAVPNKHGLIGRALVGLMNLLDRTHISTYTRDRWLELASELGFREIRVLNATWFRPTEAELAKYLAPILIVVLYRQPKPVFPDDLTPGDDIDVAMALARHPELILSHYE